MKAIVVVEYFALISFISLILFIAYIEFERFQRLEMYDSNLDFLSYSSGYYSYSENFYCVWTQGKTDEQVNKTEYHEFCHALIDDDPDAHFCESPGED